MIAEILTDEGVDIIYVRVRRSARFERAKGR
jgi:hypothetical protein